MSVVSWSHRLTALRRCLVLATVLALLLASFAVANTAAAPAAPVDNTFTNTAAPFNSMRTAGRNTIIDVTGTVAYTGTLIGTSVVEGHLILHPSSSNYHAVETFTGTVNGMYGTLTFNITGGDVGGVYHATAVIIGGTGGLADLHGVLRLDGMLADDGPLGTYTGQLH